MILCIWPFDKEEWARISNFLHSSMFGSRFGTLGLGHYSNPNGWQIHICMNGNTLYLQACLDVIQILICTHINGNMTLDWHTHFHLYVKGYVSCHVHICFISRQAWTYEVFPFMHQRVHHPFGSLLTWSNSKGWCIHLLPCAIVWPQ